MSIIVSNELMGFMSIRVNIESDGSSTRRLRLQVQPEELPVSGHSCRQIREQQLHQ